MADKNEEPIFGRYSREECGLPSGGPDPLGERLGVGRIIFIMLVLGILAWFAGEMVANRRALAVAALSRDVAAAPDERSHLLARGRMFAAALPGRPGLRRDLAIAAMTAGDLSPRPAGYYGNALALLEREADQDDSPIGRFITEITLAGVQGEMRNYHDAFAALDRAGQALEQVENENLRRGFRLHLANAQAYYLAIAPEDEGGDPVKALELARLAVTSRDPLPTGELGSETAAFLDTLAMARYKNGLKEEAVLAQKLALGLAESRGLEVYLEHYDLFDKGAENVQ